MEYEIKLDNKFKFIEEGEGEPLVLLHGLFGALSNFQPLIEYFRSKLLTGASSKFFTRTVIAVVEPN